LLGRKELPNAPSNEKTELVLDDRILDVMDNFWLTGMPCVTMQQTPVSESHFVASQLVAWTLRTIVYATSPYPAPQTVTLVEPVLALLLLWVTICTILLSDEKTCVAVPACSTAVTTARQVLRKFEETKHVKVVSDTHRVDALAECPVLDFAENDENARAQSNTDMLVGKV